jgi:hypothetical protein
MDPAPKAVLSRKASFAFERYALSAQTVAAVFEVSSRPGAACGRHGCSRP